MNKNEVFFQTHVNQADKERPVQAKGDVILKQVIRTYTF